MAEVNCEGCWWGGGDWSLIWVSAVEAWWPHRSHFTGTKIRRQEGQEDLEVNHLSMHATWKEWLHSGKILISSPSENSVKHIAHSVEESPSPAEEHGESSAAVAVVVAEVKVDLGRDWSAFFLRPLFGGGDSPTAAELTPARRRSQAQRATAAKPATHMRAQRRAERITTMSVSAARISSGGGGAAVPRNLEDRVIFVFWCFEEKEENCESCEDKRKKGEVLLLLLLFREEEESDPSFVIKTHTYTSILIYTYMPNCR